MTARLCFLLVAALAATPQPARADQWVMGDVAELMDYTAFSPSSGVLVTLGNRLWGSGTPADGATACGSLFRIAVGVVGVTEETKNRMWSALLTAQSTNRKVQFYVDTQATAPQCGVKIVALGGALK